MLPMNHNEQQPSGNKNYQLQTGGYFMATTFAIADNKDYDDIVKKAFVLYESFEEFSFFLWKTFGNDFSKLEEVKEIRRDCFHLDNGTELPF
jgi:hypothetical protein